MAEANFIYEMYGFLEVQKMPNGLLRVYVHSCSCEMHMEVDPRAIIFSPTLEVLYSPFFFDPDLFSKEDQDWIIAKGHTWGELPQWIIDLFPQTPPKKEIYH